MSYIIYCSESQLRIPRVNNKWAKPKIIILLLVTVQRDLNLNYYLKH